MEGMRPKAIIFDFDGTLLDTIDDLADSMNRALAERGMPEHPTDSYRYFVGDGMENLARQAAPAGTPPGTVRELVRRMEEIYSGGWANKTRPYPGIPPLLEELRRLGLALSILSNKPDSFTRIMASHYFGGAFFAAVLGARDGMPKKPDPAGALEIARLLAVPPKEFLYLGDTNTDMRTGRSAGMRTIGVSWGFRPAEELAATGAEAIVDSPIEVLSLLG
jgi:phosphoglycolate phosphatase